MKSTYRVLGSRTVILILIFLLSIVSICIGAKEFSLLDLIKGNEHVVNLVIISRIPRLVSILVTGASLSIAGLIMQTITSNKFVSPATAGTMEWCKFGIILAMIFTTGESKMVKILFAFAVSLAGTIFFMFMLQKIKFKSIVLVPLVGMMLGNVVSSLTGYLAYKHDVIQNMSSWLQGSFSLVIKGNYELLYIGIPFLIIAYCYANKFTIAGMGDGFATSLGLNHKAVVTVGMVIVAFITSITVVTIGSVPFIGLVVPNIVAMYKGDNLKNTLFDTAIFGALFVLVCDIIGRTIYAPYEVSISVVISIIGSILFLTLILRKEGK